MDASELKSKPITLGVLGLLVGMILGAFGIGQVAGGINAAVEHQGRMIDKLSTAVDKVVLGYANHDARILVLERERR